MDIWIANFKKPEEKYFAARILDALIYRSDRQTIALMKQLFQRSIPDLARRNGLDLSLRNVYQNLQFDGNDPGVRVVPVIPPGDSPTNSGPSIARMLRRGLGFSERWFLYPDRVASEIGNVSRFIFADDFLGTGKQFSDFLVNSNLNTLLSAGCFVYAPLAAHVDGVKAIQQDFPDVHIVTVELLDDRQAFFHTESGSFPDDVNSTEAARDFYYNLLDDRKITIVGPDRRGFGHFELVYAFEHGVPDNSLPLLWWRRSQDWQPLFDR